MNRFTSLRISPRAAAAAALAVGILGATTAAQARSDVVFSIGFQPAPVYYQPAPVYYEPAPVYVQPQVVYTQPQPVYEQAYVYDNRYYGNEWNRRHYRQSRHAGPWGDRDGDGIANRYDRFPANPYRR